MSGASMLDNILAQPASHLGIVELYQGKQCGALVACAKQICKAEGRIIFSGMGASLFAAMPAVRFLEQQGYRAQALESAELLHYGSPALRRGDVGVLISRSGGSVEVLHLAERMRALGVTVVGVTNVPDSPLAHTSDLCLLIGAQSDQLIAVQTYTGTVLALLLLAEEVSACGSMRLADACSASLSDLSTYVAHCSHASENWRDLLDGPGALYVLGRGPALASAYEGALLLHETAKASAIGMSSGQFRHGPVEVVSQAFRAIVFGSPAATRPMDRSLANDLWRMGAHVRWIGPESESDHAPSLTAWPVLAAESPLAPLFEIVPLQFAAYRLAMWRGIVPGDFRYASEITSEESGFPLFETKLSRA